MKADDIDPSANNSRSKLGIRYATKKASAAAVAPNRLASTMSRINPRMRLAKVAAPITPAALTTERVSSCAFVEAGVTTVGSGMNLDSSGTTPGSLSSERYATICQPTSRIQVFDNVWRMRRIQPFWSLTSWCCQILMTCHPSERSFLKLRWSRLRLVRSFSRQNGDSLCSHSGSLQPCQKSPSTKMVTFL